MSGYVLAILESLAYAIAKGVARAYFDVLREPHKAIEAVTNDEDIANRIAFDAALDGMQSYEPHDSIAKPESPKPAGNSAEGGHPGKTS